MYLDDIARMVGLEVENSTGERLELELLRLYAVLVRVKGLETKAEDVHDCWVAWRAQSDPAHEALIPFLELDRPTQLKDLPYLQAIHAVSKRVSN